MDPDLFRVSLRAIFAAIVTEISDQFLFLGVDRDHRLLLGQCCGHLGVDAGELRIPVGVAVALRGLAVGLQAVPAALSNSATRVRLTWWPCACSAGARRRTLLQVHRNGDAGSPRVKPAPAQAGGSTSASRSASRVGSPAFAGAGSCKSPACAPPPAAEPARTAHPAPIPSDRARSCSAPCRSPSPPRQCHHIPRQTPPPRRPGDDPVSSRNGATVKNRSRMGSTSFTTTIYGMKRRL